MSNSIAEYWDADGISLHTFAQSIETSGEHIRGAPYLRGSNIQVPLRPGEIWVPKVPGPRTITLKMWVRGSDSDGIFPSTPAAAHGRFNDNFRALRQLLWRTDRQIALTKRWLSEDTVLHSATAQCEFAAGLDNMQIIDQHRDAQAGKFTTDMRLSDPYFYGASQSLTPPGSSFTVTNIGDDTARKLTITFGSGGTLENVTTGRILLVPGACVIDVWNFAAPGVLADLSVVGQPGELFWMTLVVGANVFNHSGVTDITYSPVYQ